MNENENEKQRSDTELALIRRIEEGTADLDLSPKEKNDLFEWERMKVAQERLALTRHQLVGGHYLPDFEKHLFTGQQAFEAVQADGGRVDHLIADITTRGSSNLLVAPTNSGGSTLLDHVAGCYLTGDPFLGVFEVANDEYRVLHINPEEEVTTPFSRLLEAGVDLRDPDISERYLGLHTRDARLYFNHLDHVEAIITLLTERGWDDDPRPLIVIVDGTQPTLDGEMWNHPLEQWKRGVGIFREALNPAALYVRTQTTSKAARESEKDHESGEVYGEDVVGGQILQWPDTRLILNRNGSSRKLTVRGRRVYRGGQKVERWSCNYRHDPETQTFEQEDLSDIHYAMMIVLKTLTHKSNRWREMTADPDKPVKADIYRALSEEHEKISEATFKKAMKGWAFKGGKWVSA